jgi:metal-responsive CopG/Arc/MetJ family transcriptional regulator
MTKQNNIDGKVKISVNVPEKLVIELDAHRLQTGQDRSTWISSAIMEKMASIKRNSEKNKMKED